MNILLDAYFDNNFGDDIFIKTITEMFPACKFYSYLEYYPEEVLGWAEQLPNLYLLPESGVFLDKNMFDAYICVGGDIFPDGGDFTWRKEAVRSVKQAGGIVAFLGFSLFHEYGEQTGKDITRLMEQADIVAPRDAVSAAFLEKLMPGKEFPVMTDLAFSYPWLQREGCTGKCVGISVRRPGYADEKDMENYCKGLAEMMNAWLEEHEDATVKLFSLSCGTSPDRETAEAVCALVREKDRVSHVVYTGDIRAVQEELCSCCAVICTRLHAMIACIAMGIPFLPIVYEVKMEHILQEIGYQGRSFRFDRLEGLGQCLEKLVEENTTEMSTDTEGRAESGEQYSQTLKEEYLEKSQVVLSKLNTLLQLPEGKMPIRKQDATGPVLKEKEYGMEQAAMVAQKNEELEKMAGEMEEQQKVITECQNTIARYLQTIEELNENNRQLTATLQEINEQRANMEQMLYQKCSELEDEKQQVAYQLEILNAIRPYMISNSVGGVLSLYRKRLVKVNSNAEEEWQRIMQYYEEPGDDGAEE